MSILRNMPREFGRVWLWCMLMPLPVLVFWQSHDGRFVGLCLFFAASSLFVARAFNGNSLKPLVLAAQQGSSRALWRERLLVAGLALVVSWAIFSATSLLLNDSSDWTAPLLALAALIPSLCIAPYYALRIHRPFAAVVFTVFSLASMKLVAGSVTDLVYGWHADAAGRTTMTWTHPNLIVYAFLVSSAALSSMFYVMGRRRFYSVCDQDGFEGRAHAEVNAKFEKIKNEERKLMKRALIIGGGIIGVLIGMAFVMPAVAQYQHEGVMRNGEPWLFLIGSLLTLAGCGAAFRGFGKSQA